MVEVADKVSMAVEVAAVVVDAESCVASVTTVVVDTCSTAAVVDVAAVVVDADKAVVVGTGCMAAAAVETHEVNVVVIPVNFILI